VSGDDGNGAASDQVLRAQLPRTWDTLIARHGRATAIQRAAAGPLLEGRDALLCAPTAAGKTVAFLAPLVEAGVPPGPGLARLLVVAPTRALVNDLARRIEGPLGRIGISVGRWTGDHHDGGRPQPLTVLTPEALDARLSRSPRVLDGVSAVVLDELHVLDGTARGDQLRVLVHRLRVERRDAQGPRPLQVVGASATVARPRELAARYLVEPVIIEAGERRRVQARILRGIAPPAVEAHLAQAVRDGFRKVLLFVDSRAAVEELAAWLRQRPPFRGAVIAHHGSLSRRARLDAEARFQRAPVAICVATSTLELGIDIGDIDLVALLRPPPSLAALSQRIGRGRRRGGAHPVLCLAATAFEEALFRGLLSARRDGDWPAPAPTFRAGVLLQQAVVVAASRPSRTVDAGALARRLPADLAATWPPARLTAVLEGAAEIELLHATGVRGPGGARYRLGLRGERSWHRGTAHANLAEGPRTRVEDALTGELIAHIDEAAPSQGLGGQARRVVHEDGERVVVRPGGEGGRVRFGGKGGDRWTAGLVRLLLGRLELPVRARLVLEDGSVGVLHGLGDAGGRVLGDLLRAAGVVEGKGLQSRGPFGLVLVEPDLARWPAPDRVRSLVDADHHRLGERLSLGSYHCWLPEAEQRAVVAEAVGCELVAAWLVGGPPPVVPWSALAEAAVCHGGRRRSTGDE